MKNLKKVLALVLAIACAFTMFAGAAFTDEADIQATDAVNMLTALGVIEGFEDGSFQPDGTVTRAQMAKMIFVVRNNKIDDTAYKNNSTQFTDVNDNWAAGYIKFCESQGIIAGKSATQFKPNDTVTGVEAAKMLLVVAGYDPDKAGLTGANWKTNTLKWAGSAGLLDDVNAPLEEGLPRQYAAQVIYNALDANRVKWSDDSNSFDDILNGGVKETVGRAYMGLYNSVGVLVSVNKDALSLSNIDGAESDPISTSTVNGNVVYTYGTEFTKVTTNYSDLMGQKVKVMFKDGKTNSVMGVAPLSDNSTWQVAANGTEKDDDRVKFDGKSYSVEYFGHEDSKVVEEKATGDAIATYIDGQVANGTTLTKLDNNTLNPNMYTFVDANGNGKIDTLIVTTYNVAKVTYAASDRIIAGGKTYKFDDDNIDSNIVKDDWVIITENLFDDCKDIVKADVSSAKLDALRDKKSATPYFDGGRVGSSVLYNEYQLDGSWYKGAGVVQSSASESDLNTVKAGNDVQYVVVNNVLFYVKRVTGDGSGKVDDVAVVIRKSTGGAGDEVKLAFFDGTTQIVSVDSDSEVPFGSLTLGKAYEYSVSGGEYSFEELKPGILTKSGASDAAKARAAEYEEYYGDLSYRAVDQTLGGGIWTVTALTNANFPVSGGVITSLDTFSGIKIDDKAEVILYTSTGSGDSKRITGKQFKALDTTKVQVGDVYAFSGEMSGLDRIGALVVKVDNLTGVTTTYSNYGYIVEEASRVNANTIQYTFWNGTDNVTVQEKKSSTSGRKKGTVIGYDTLNTSGDVNVIDDVEDLIVNNHITFTAITKVNDSKNTAQFAVTPIGANTSELKEAGTVLYIDSDASDNMAIGLKEGEIRAAQKYNGSFMANALVIGNDDEIELLIVDQGEYLKNDVYKDGVTGGIYGSASTTKSIAISGIPDLEVGTLANESVNVTTSNISDGKTVTASLSNANGLSVTPTSTTINDNTATFTITGTPTATGTGTLTIRVDGETATKTFDIESNTTGQTFSSVAEVINALTKGDVKITGAIPSGTIAVPAGKKLTLDGIATDNVTIAGAGEVELGENFDVMSTKTVTIPSLTVEKSVPTPASGGSLSVTELTATAETITAAEVNALLTSGTTVNVKEISDAITISTASKTLKADSLAAGLTMSAAGTVEVANGIGGNVALGAATTLNAKSINGNLTLSSAASTVVVKDEITGDITTATSGDSVTAGSVDFSKTLTTVAGTTLKITGDISADVTMKSTMLGTTEFAGAVSADVTMPDSGAVQVLFSGTVNTDNVKFDASNNDAVVKFSGSNVTLGSTVKYCNGSKVLDAVGDITGAANGFKYNANIDNNNTAGWKSV